MRNWSTDSGGVSNENLNATLSPEDAIVDPNMGTTDGTVYQTVDLALAAGKRSLILVPGTHDGFTISAGNIHVRGIGSPGDITPYPTRHAYVNGAITIANTAYNVIVENLTVRRDTSGFFLNCQGAPRLTLRRIYTTGGTGDHFKFSGGLDRVLVEDCASYNCSGNAFILSDTYSSAYGAANLFRNCYANICQGHAFYTGSGGTESPTMIHFDNCGAEACGQSWGYGFYVQANLNGTFKNCWTRGSYGDGFYLETPDVDVRRMFIGCRAEESLAGRGFVRQTAYTPGSGVGDELVVGCMAVDMAAGWINFSGGGRYAYV